MDTNGQRQFFGPVRGSRGWVAALVVGILALVTAASAIAAHPKKNARFTGIVIGPEINGFKPPVAFKVSSNGKTLMGFTYSTLGCFSEGGFRPGVDYYTQPSALMRLGKLKVSRAGTFSKGGVVSIFKGGGGSVTTTSRVTGSFTSRTTVSGTLTFSQKISPGGAICTTAGTPIEFTAKA
jgi:hypothetical protein